MLDNVIVLRNVLQRRAASPDGRDRQVPRRPAPYRRVAVHHRLAGGVRRHPAGVPRPLDKRAAHPCHRPGIPDWTRWSAAGCSRTRSRCSPGRPVGKTLAALQLRGRGATATGRRCLFCTFDETRGPARPQRRPAGASTSEAMEAAGRLRVIAEYPEAASLEDHFLRLRQRRLDFAPDRVVIDTLSSLERVVSARSLLDFVIALDAVLREHEITTPLTSAPAGSAAAGRNAGERGRDRQPHRRHDHAPLRRAHRRHPARDRHAADTGKPPRPCHPAGHHRRLPECTSATRCPGVAHVPVRERRAAPRVRPGPPSRTAAIRDARPGHRGHDGRSPPTGAAADRAASATTPVRRSSPRPPTGSSRSTRTAGSGSATRPPRNSSSRPAEELVGHPVRLSDRRGPDATEIELMLPDGGERIVEMRVTSTILEGEHLHVAALRGRHPPPAASSRISSRRWSASTPWPRWCRTSCATRWRRSACSPRRCATPAALTADERAESPTGSPTATVTSRPSCASSSPPRGSTSGPSGRPCSACPCSSSTLERLAEFGEQVRGRVCLVSARTSPRT